MPRNPIVMLVIIAALSVDMPAQGQTALGQGVVIPSKHPWLRDVRVPAVDGVVRIGVQHYPGFNDSGAADPGLSIEQLEAATRQRKEIESGVAGYRALLEARLDARFKAIDRQAVQQDRAYTRLFGPLVPYLQTDKGVIFTRLLTDAAIVENYCTKQAPTGDCVRVIRNEEAVPWPPNEFEQRAAFRRLAGAPLDSLLAMAATVGDEAVLVVRATPFRYDFDGGGFAVQLHLRSSQNDGWFHQPVDDWEVEVMPGRHERDFAGQTWPFFRVAEADGQRLVEEAGGRGLAWFGVVRIRIDRLYTQHGQYDGGNAFEFHVTDPTVKLFADVALTKPVGTVSLRDRRPMVRAPDDR